MNGLTEFVDMFDSREKAIAIWLAVFFAWALTNKGVRKAFFALLKGFTHRKIILACVALLAYIALAVRLLYLLGIWNTFLVKDTIYWLFGTAFVLMFNVNDKKDGLFFKKVALDSLKITVALEFIVNFYTFSFWVELLLIPLVFLVVAMQALASLKEECAVTRKFFDLLVAIIGLGLLSVTIYQMYSSWNSFASMDTLKSFFAPILLTIIYIPFLYLFTLFVTYESLFVRLDFLLKEKQLAKFAKRKILRICLINLKMLNALSKVIGIELRQVHNKEDMLNLLAGFKNMYYSRKVT